MSIYIPFTLKIRSFFLISSVYVLLEIVCVCVCVCVCVSYLSSSPRSSYYYVETGKIY